MRDLYFPTLVLVLIIVVEIAALQPRFTDQSKNTPDYLSLIEGRSYGSSNKVKGEHNVDPSYFHAYLRPLFSMKSAIQSSIHRIDDGRAALNAIIDMKTKLTDLLAEAADDYMELANLKCMVNLPDAESRYEGPLFGDKCYVVSNQVFLPDLNYEEAQQKCLSLGGKLAEPNLMPGSTFGADLASVYGTLDQANYWMFGTATPVAPYQIVAGGGFIIPEDFFRYITMNNVKKSPPEVNADSGLTLVGDLPPGTSEWYIEPKDTNEELPYICEFRAIVNPEPDTDDGVMRYFRSPLMRRLLKMSSKAKLAKSFKRLSHSPSTYRRPTSDQETKVEELKLNQQTKALQNPELNVTSVDEYSNSTSFAEKKQI